MDAIKSSGIKSSRIKSSWIKSSHRRAGRAWSLRDHAREQGFVKRRGRWMPVWEAIWGVVQKQ